MEIKAHFREGRKQPWEARWWVNRKMRSKFFASEKERNKFIRDFQREIGKHGDDVFKVDVNRQREWQEVDSILPEVSPIELAEHWLLTHGGKERRSFREAMKLYLLEMKRAGRDEEYQKHTLRALKRFAVHHGEVPVDSVTSQQVSDFLSGLPFSAVSKNHYRTYLVSAFKFFIKNGWAKDNPASAVSTPKVTNPEPGILTVAEAEALFRENEKVDPGICGLLALGAFAGMRSSAICRLSWDELDFENRAILTPAAKTKKGRRQFIEDLPDNLWAWLERTPKKAFNMPVREFSKRREEAFVRAGLLVPKAMAKKKGIQVKSPPKNCLRHSFVSYHVALHRNPGKTALLVSHKDQKILWEHYLGVATKEDAKMFFAIQP